MHQRNNAIADERVRRFNERYTEMPWQAVPPCVNTSFPQLTGTDLSQLEASLNYKFCNCTLLLEALTHPSCDTQSMTPSNAKLVFRGPLTTEALLVDLLLGKASFCRAETARRDAVPRARTYAVVAEQDFNVEVGSGAWLMEGLRGEVRPAVPQSGGTAGAPGGLLQQHRLRGLRDPPTIAQGPAMRLAEAPGRRPPLRSRLAAGGEARGRGRVLAGGP